MSNQSNIDIKEFHRGLRQVKQILTEALKETDQIAKDTVQYLKQRIPVKTGKVRKSISLERRNLPGGREYAIKSPKADIVRYLSFGTRQHYIFPIYKSALHWIDPITGKHRFSAGHKVRGIKARGMIMAALFYLRVRMSRYAKEQGQKISKVFAK